MTPFRPSPVPPLHLQDYICGITELTLLEYIAASFVDIAHRRLINVSLGAAGKAASGEGGRKLKWGIFAVGLIATVMVAVFVTKHAKAQLPDRAGQKRVQFGHLFHPPGAAAHRGWLHEAVEQRTGRFAGAADRCSENCSWFYPAECSDADRHSNRPRGARIFVC